MRNQLILSLALLFTGVHCSSSSNNMSAPVTNGPTARLVVERTTLAHPSDFRAQATLVNRGPEALEVNTYVLSLPVFALEIKNDKGELLPHLPPPVPRPDAVKAGEKTLAAGETLSFTLSGLAVDSKILGKGTFQVSFVVKGKRASAGQTQAFELRSDPVSITIP